MKRKAVLFALVGAAMTLPLTAEAQGGGGAGQQRPAVPPMTQPQQRPPMDMTRDMDRDRDRDMDQNRDMDRDMDRDRDRDRLHMMDQDRIRDEDIYGHQMMTAEEREAYRNRMRTVQTDREWAQIRAEHQKEMQARAKNRGMDLDPPVYGQHMMTMEERSRFTERMQAATNDAERARIREEHRMEIQERARELGVDAPPPDQD